MTEQIKKAIKGLRKIRRNPPKEWKSDELEIISWTLDYLEEDMVKLTQGLNANS